MASPVDDGGDVFGFVLEGQPRPRQHVLRRVLLHLAGEVRAELEGSRLDVEAEGGVCDGGQLVKQLFLRPTTGR